MSRHTYFPICCQAPPIARCSNYYFLMNSLGIRLEEGWHAPEEVNSAFTFCGLVVPFSRGWLNPSMFYLCACYCRILYHYLMVHIIPTSGQWFPSLRFNTMWILYLLRCILFYSYGVGRTFSGSLTETAWIAFINLWNCKRTGQVLVGVKSLHSCQVLSGCCGSGTSASPHEIHSLLRPYCCSLNAWMWKISSMSPGRGLDPV